MRTRSHHKQYNNNNSYNLFFSPLFSPRIFFRHGNIRRPYRKTCIGRIGSSGHIRFAANWIDPKAIGDMARRRASTEIRHKIRGNPKKPIDYTECRRNGSEIVSCTCHQHTIGQRREQCVHSFECVGWSVCRSGARNNCSSGKFADRAWRTGVANAMHCKCSTIARTGNTVAKGWRSNWKLWCFAHIGRSMESHVDSVIGQFNAYRRIYVPSTFTKWWLSNGHIHGNRHSSRAADIFLATAKRNVGRIWGSVDCAVRCYWWTNATRNVV